MSIKTDIESHVCTELCTDGHHDWSTRGGDDGVASWIMPG